MDGRPDGQIDSQIDRYIDRKTSKVIGNPLTIYVAIYM